MKRSAALVALALWLLVGSAHAQEPVPFDYRCDAAAAATTPAALPADGWQRAEDGELPRAAGSPCWLRIDVARFAPRILGVGRFSQKNMEVAVFSRDGRPLASASRAGSRDQVIVGNDDSVFSRMLFPTLRAEDGPVLMRVQRSRDVTLTAVDLVRSVQGEQNYNFVHLGVGLFYVIVTLVAASLGVFGRDRGQFVFAALFAWLAFGEWVNISPSLPAGLASGVVAARRVGKRLAPAHHPGRGAAAASARARTALVPLDDRHGRVVPAAHSVAADRGFAHRPPLPSGPPPDPRMGRRDRGVVARVAARTSRRRAGRS